ncbi:ATP-binding protein [Geofilum sp. OHC36d9]|uniref:ATP-binding protein n=1 Tax=Geofilum sp. OHC36d9 TaxID=3458413 RepID=UPI004033803B
MEREMIHIDETICDGCGQCIPACHEGALQIIDGKARLVSDLLCDGLGACLGHCPQGAITIEKREAEPYDEIQVMQNTIPKGKNTVIAHLKHLKDHHETVFLKEGLEYLQSNKESLPFNFMDVIKELNGIHKAVHTACSTNSCPGSAERALKPTANKTFSPVAAPTHSTASELRQWPVQMHLINPSSSMFKGSDLVLAADCAGFAMADFHQRILKGKTLAIACPKLDHDQDTYLNKLVQLIDTAKINTLTVVIMEVPCCSGLLQLAKNARLQSQRKIPLKMIRVSAEGNILNDEWL